MIQTTYTITLTVTDSNFQYLDGVIQTSDALKLLAAFELFQYLDGVIQTVPLFTIWPMRHILSIPRRCDSDRTPDLHRERRPVAFNTSTV